MRLFLFLLGSFSLLAAPLAQDQDPAPIPEPEPIAQDELEVYAVTFADSKLNAYAPIRKLCEPLGLAVHWDDETSQITIEDQPVKEEDIRKLFSTGGNFFRVGALRDYGVEGWLEEDDESVRWMSHGVNMIKVVTPPQRAEVSISRQRVLAWQGPYAVLYSNVSTGRGGSTPRGDYEAGPYKAWRHYSSIYNNAPMPYSVQINGNIFFHGSGSVPRYPASHGCIRMPLNRGNPARYLYNWIEVGTAVSLRSSFSEEANEILATIDAY